MQIEEAHAAAAPAAAAAGEAAAAPDDDVLAGPPSSTVLADHEAYMLQIIVETKFWRSIDEHMEYWKSNCGARFKIFTFDPYAEEQERPTQLYTSMMMCAYCGVICMGSILSAHGVRRKTEKGGVDMSYMPVPAGAGEAPAAAAMPWLADLVLAKNVRIREPAPDGDEPADGDEAAAEQADPSPAAGAEAQPPQPRRTNAAAAAHSRREARAAEVDSVPCWNVCAKCCSSSGVRALRQSYLVPWTTEYAKKLHSVSSSANLHRLSVVDVRSQVQRQYNGVGRGVLIPGGLTSGILVSWNADTLTLSGDRDAPALQWLLEEMISRDSPVLRQFVCLLEQEGSGGPGVVVLPPGAISKIVSRVRARDMRVGVPSLDELTSEENAERSADAEAARRRDLITLDAAGLGVELGVESFAAHSKVFVCGSAKLRPGPWLSPAAPRDVEISTFSDGSGKVLSLELGMFTYLFLDGVGYYDNRRARGVPPLGLMEYLKMRMQGMFTPFTMTGSYVLFMYQLRQAHLLIRSTSENTMATELRRVSAARLARGDEDDGGQEAWLSVIKWKLSPSLPGTPSYFRRKLNEVRAMRNKFGMADLVVTLTQDDATETRWPEFDEMETLESIYVNEAPGAATFRDMPVEAARLFHDRFWAWFKYFVLDKNGPQIYCNVVAWVVRFVDICGCTHKWVHPFVDGSCAALGSSTAESARLHGATLPTTDA